MKRFVLTEGDRALIVSLRGTYTSAQIASLFKISDGTVRKIWNDFDWVRDRKNRSKHGPVAPPTELPSEPIVRTGVTLLELVQPHCRWIIGKDSVGVWRYCARPRAIPYGERNMYCEKHSAMAFVDWTLPQPVRIVGKFAGPENCDQTFAERLYMPTDLVDQFNASPMR
jgi:hypothetical protein